MKIRFHIDPLKAVESDKKPYCRGWGALFALAIPVLFLPLAYDSRGPVSLMLPWFIFFALMGYFGGMLMGWFFWGLFFEPQVEARKRGQGAV